MLFSQLNTESWEEHSGYRLFQLRLKQKEQGSSTINEFKTHNGFTPISVLES